MEEEDFRDLKQMYCSSTSPFIVRKKDKLGADVSISKMVRLQIRAESYGILFFKTAFDEDDFKEVDLLRTSRRLLPIGLPPTTTEGPNVSATKQIIHQIGSQTVPCFLD
ncbi:hypothetical protein HHI36_015232 [Cryptolaemus montrouzieri]|uniref:Uncharacterized protein n=1 Tax=Cryptolaemus montrouzieri TaxID=559131 RepID=A0ABD2N5H9_9CUCU